MENGQQQNTPRKRRSPGKQGEILRREGLYRNDIQRYDEIVRETGIKALSQPPPGEIEPGALLTNRLDKGLETGHDASRDFPSVQSSSMPKRSLRKKRQ
jgi:hypothetical protein